MTLDEAITHCEEVAKEKQEQADSNIQFEKYGIKFLYDGEEYRKCCECAEEHSQLAEWLKELKQLREQTTWITVNSDRSPEVGSECLVVDKDGEYGVGFYREDVKAWDSFNWGWLERKDRVNNKEIFTQPCGIGKVIAWMPLPKPYEPQESEE